MAMRRLFVAAALVPVATCSFAQSTPTPAQRAKTTQQILDRAHRNEVQELSILLDAKEVKARDEKRRQAERPQRNEKDLDDLRAREMDDLKNQTIPRGDPNIEWVQSFKYFAIVIVRVRGEQALNRLLANPRIRLIEDATKTYPPALNESLPLIHQPSAISSNITGAGYRIVVLDGPVNPTLPSFTTSRATGCRYPGESTPSNWPAVGSTGCLLSSISNTGPGDPSAPPDHGTLSAAIAARTAPGVKIATLNVMVKSTAYLNEYAAGFQQVLSALTWVYDNRYSSPAPIVALNMSFGSYYRYRSECSGGWADAVSDLRTRGIAPVVAAGNEGWKDGVSEPACSPGAVRVGMVYDTDFIYDVQWPLVTRQPNTCVDSKPRADQVPCASNSSSLISIWAPGANVSVDSVGGAGTSAAAPFVTASIAMLKQAFPSESVDQAVYRLVSSGKTVQDRANGVSKPRLDIAAALASANVGSGTGTTIPSGPSKSVTATNIAVRVLLSSP